MKLSVLHVKKICSCWFEKLKSSVVHCFCAAHTQSIMAFNKEIEEKIVVAKHCLSWSDTDS